MRITLNEQLGRLYEIVAQRKAYTEQKAEELRKQIDQLEAAMDNLLQGVQADERAILATIGAACGRTLPAKVQATLDEQGAWHLEWEERPDPAPSPAPPAPAPVKKKAPRKRRSKR